MDSPGASKLMALYCNKVKECTTIKKTSLKTNSQRTKVNNVQKRKNNSKSRFQVVHTPFKAKEKW